MFYNCYFYDYKSRMKTNHDRYTFVGRAVVIVDKGWRRGISLEPLGVCLGLSGFLRRLESGRSLCHR